MLQTHRKVDKYISVNKSQPTSPTFMNMVHTENFAGESVWDPGPIQVEDEHLNATQNALWAVGTSLIHPQILQILNKSVYYTLCYEYYIRTKSNTEQLLVLHQREQILHTIFKYCNRGHKSMSHQNSFKWHQNIAGVRSTCSSSVEKMLWRAYGSRLVWLGRPNSSPATRAVSATGCSSM